jgi:hypothetical protein
MKFTHASMTAALTCAATLLTAQTVAALERGPHARSLQEVESIWLDSSSCSSGISHQLDRGGFLLTGSPRMADAVLEVNVNHLDTDMGAAARYSATLHGRNGRVLFSTSGRENSVSERELCQDIGDDIADRIESRMG